MTLSIDQFVARLCDSGLLSAEKVAEFRATCADATDAAALADALVTQQRLTAYQAKVLLEGRSDPLVLSDYVILTLIGKGGMGKVYKAQHRHMDRIVALKLLPTELAGDADAVIRFEREIKAAARLTHPNIVTAYDARIEGGVQYLVCEFINGCNLFTAVKQNGTFDIPTAVEYLLQAARGLDHAHRQGIVHRDVKPSNLMLSSSGEIKLLDLGLARFSSLFGSGNMVSTVAELTGAGRVVGTVDYMAPEQAIESQPVDGRADIYSLGCTLYYLLAGQPPFPKGSAIERLLAHQQKTVPRLKDVQPQISDELDALHKRMVARNVEDRIPRMSDVVHALEKVLEHGAIGQAEQPRSVEYCETGRYDAVTTSARPIVQAAPAETGSAESAPAELLSAENDTLVQGRPIGFAHWKRFVPVVLAMGIVVAVVAWQLRGGPNPPVAPIVPSVERPASNGTHVHRPPRLSIPAAPDRVGEIQSQWAEFLKVPATEKTFSEILLVLIPPGLAEAQQPAAPDGQETSQLLAPNEVPRRKSLISVDHAFYCSAHEISRQQFIDVLGFDPSTSHDLDNTPEGMSRPVEMVNWIQAVEFCNALSRKCDIEPYYEIQEGIISAEGGRGYRLPTEDEWEHACRAGSAARFSFGKKLDDLYDYGWFAVNSSNQTQPVGLKRPNALGLYDMHGNVWEWCQDVSKFSQKPEGAIAQVRRIVRGGSWMHHADQCDAESRYHYAETDKGPSGGFRVVRTIGSADE